MYEWNILYLPDLEEPYKERKSLILYYTILIIIIIIIIIIQKETKTQGIYLKGSRFIIHGIIKVMHVLEVFTSWVERKGLINNVFVYANMWIRLILRNHLSLVDVEKQKTNKRSNMCVC